MNLKKLNDILKDMALWVSSSSDRLTNMRPGSVVRTLLEAVAVEIEALYLEVRRGFSKAIENAIYNSFGFYRKQATPSTGEVTLLFGTTLYERFHIPKGTEFFTVPIGGEVLYFRSVEDDVFAVQGDTSLTLLVECTTPGVVGNVPPHSIRRMVNPSPIIQDIYNEARFFNGMPEETKESRKKRFSAFIDSLPRGTTPSIEYGCLQVPGITGVAVEEKIGVINIYAHNKSGGLTDEQLRDINNMMPEYKCAGIKANISSTIPRIIDMNISITIAEGQDEYSYSEAVFNSVSAYINNFTVGKSVIRADLIRFIMGIDERVILNVELDIEKDIDVLPYELVRSGEIFVSIME